VVESLGQIKRQDSTATGCFERLSSRFGARADANIAARRRTRGSRHEPARRRADASSEFHV